MRMSWRCVGWVVPAVLMGWVSGAQAHRAHQHGVAALEVAMDGERLELTLHGPQDNAVGFEHAPRTAAQKKALAQMHQSLQQADRWFLTNPEARCAVQARDIESDPEHNDEHSDIEVSLSYRCQAPDQLRALVVMPWQAWPRLRQLQATVVGPQGARKVVLKRPVGQDQVVLPLAGGR